MTEPSGPTIVVGAFLAKIRGELEAVPLEDLVTDPGKWDLERAAASLEGWSLLDHVEYPSPSWARAFVVQGAPESGELDPGQKFLTWAVWLRYEDELRDWRVFCFAAPSVALEEISEAELGELPPL